MATAKDLKKAASAMLLDWSQPDAARNLIERINDLTRRIEKLTESDRTANRDRSIRVSPDGMYLRDNAGSYISKTEADRAVKTIERIAKKRK